MIKILMNEMELIEEAEDITGYDYKSEITEDNYTDTNTIMRIIEDLIDEYRKLEKKYDDFKQCVKDNYRHIDDYQ